MKKIIVNSFTIIRLLGIIMLPLFNHYFKMKIVIIILGILFLTDYIDGFLARKLKVTSLFGSLADAAADKLLAIAALLVITKNHPIMIFPVITEIIIVIINIIKTLKGDIIESIKIGKIKTGILSSVIILSMINIFIKKDILNIIPILSIIAGLFGIITAYKYVTNKTRNKKIKSIKLKNKKELKHIMFDTEYYEETRNLPLINKIGEITYEKP